MAIIAKNKKDGVLILSKSEKKSLEIIKKHILIDINFREEGSFNKLNIKNEYVFDIKDKNLALQGIEIIDFILKFTKGQ